MGLTKCGYSMEIWWPLKVYLWKPYWWASIKSSGRTLAVMNMMVLTTSVEFNWNITERGWFWRHTKGMLSLKHHTHERQCVGISTHRKRVENVTKFDKIWGISQAFDISSQSKQKGRSKQRSKTSFTVVFVVTWRIINEFEKSSVIHINSILAWVGDSCTVSYCIALLRNKVVIGRMQLFLSEALQMLK